MKKIKKILLLLLAFSFTTLLFNSQAYAVEYYTFEFEIIDVTNTSDVEYTPLTLYDDLKSFLLKYGDPEDYYYYYFDNNKAFLIEPNGSITYLDESIQIDFNINDNYIMLTDTDLGVIPVGSYILTTDIPITFTKTFWDQIIDVVGDIAVAFQAAASAGISLIYDGTALTSLGEIITITLGVGLVIGLFYLVIRVLPGARL